MRFIGDESCGDNVVAQHLVHMLHSLQPSLFRHLLARGGRNARETLFMSRITVKESRKGFTLVELAVVIVIIGVLAAFGVPQFLKSVERSKAGEAFNYLAAVRSAQERFVAKQGVYTSDASSLDITQVPPKYFDIGTINVDNSLPGAPSWFLTLTRKSTNSSYGAYTVTFTQNGFNTNSTDSTIMDSTRIEVCPMGK
jgi:prepilin-type N-terminal cleavage/methylation domain-containing protein